MDNIDMIFLIAAMSVLSVVILIVGVYIWELTEESPTQLNEKPCVLPEHYDDGLCFESGYISENKSG